MRRKRNNLLEWVLNLKRFVKIFVDLNGITVKNKAAELLLEGNTEANFRRFYCFQKYTTSLFVLLLSSHNRNKQGEASLLSTKKTKWNNETIFAKYLRNLITKYLQILSNFKLYLNAFNFVKYVQNYCWLWTLFQSRSR